MHNIKLVSQLILLCIGFFLMPHAKHQWFLLVKGTVSIQKSQISGIHENFCARSKLCQEHLRQLDIFSSSTKLLNLFPPSRIRQKSAFNTIEEVRREYLKSKETKTNPKRKQIFQTHRNIYVCILKKTPLSPNTAKAFWSSFSQT